MLCLTCESEKKVKNSNKTQKLKLIEIENGLVVVKSKGREWKKQVNCFIFIVLYLNTLNNIFLKINSPAGIWGRIGKQSNSRPVNKEIVSGRSINLGRNKIYLYVKYVSVHSEEALDITITQLLFVQVHFNTHSQRLHKTGINSCNTLKKFAILYNCVIELSRDQKMRGNISIILLKKKNTYSLLKLFFYSLQVHIKFLWKSKN